MAWRRRSMFLSGFSFVLTMLAVQPAGAQQSGLPPITPSSPPEVARVHTLDQFAGQWFYNADESINVATGRPEQAPKSATQRTPGARAGGAGGGAGRVGPGPGYGRATGSSESGASDGAGAPRPSMLFRPGDIGPTLSMMQESRSLRRDLMEVPEALTIAITSDAVRFTDDLDRSREFQTSGLKQKYQLGAARFAASTEWKDSQIQKHIEAADGFRMTETYFLSPDAKRLFVIVRLGDTKKKGTPLVGVNRVYDRIEP